MQNGCAPSIFREMARRLLVLASLILVLAACGSTKTVTVTVKAQAPPTAKVSPLVAEGAHYFNQFACAQCHGPNGGGGIASSVPALKVIGKALTATQLRTIIDHGLGVAADPKQPYMPVWGQVISRRQVTALVAYVHAGLPAVTGATEAPVQTDQGPVVEGAQLYVRDGCIKLPRAERSRRGSESAVSRQVDPPALRRRLLPPVQHGREDHRRDPERQRPRPRADRLDAALGRHPERHRATRPGRLHQDAEDRLTI